MNFFEHQEKARKSTFLLVALFAAGVILICAGVYAVAILAYLSYREGVGPGQSITLPMLWEPRIFAAVAVFLVLVIGVRTIVKILELSRGGSYIAEMLGGTPVGRDTRDPAERKLVNVVEEMAIASGIPCPSIYVMNQETGINAFAAGFSPHNAAIAVTRGCIAELSRDELQGVVAHEFSHIFNGDMRLNMRLIGFLAGIMALGVAGYYILRSLRRARGKGAAATVLIGLSFLVLGYVGFFIGRIVQSAISRQREYLADASAVQFTRNPDGISGALKKIGGYAHSRIDNHGAKETAHMFFGNAVYSAFSLNLLSTHPSLEERIRRLDPRFSPKLEEGIGGENSRAFASQGAGQQALGLAGGFGAASRLEVGPKQVANSVGAIDRDHLELGSEMLASMPRAIAENLGTPFGACAIICGLLIDDRPLVRKKQTDILSKGAGNRFAAEVEKVHGQLRTMNPLLKLPTVDLALPALRKLSPAQSDNLFKWIGMLSRADDETTLFEFALEKVIQYRLSASRGAHKSGNRYASTAKLSAEVEILLSALANFGHPERDKAAAVFESAASHLRMSSRALSFRPLQGNIFEVLGPALDKLSSASIGVKKTILDACSFCVLYDGVVTLEEAEMLRAVAYCLNLPLPPFVNQAKKVS